MAREGGRKEGGEKRELRDYPGVMGEIVCKYLLHQRDKLVFKRKDNASHSPPGFSS